MKTLAAAGTLGRDAEARTTQGGDTVCNFSIAVDDGFGDKKTTMWFDVTRWGKGAAGLANALVKGSRVAVSGDLTTRINGDKTYLQIRADKVTIMSTPQGGQRQGDGSRGAPMNKKPIEDDWDSEVPFASNAGIW